MSSALSLATLFSAIAILTKITDLANLGWPALGCFILAVTVYAMAILVIRLRAPAFLQEYSDYKAYDDKKHSHRWILWQFYTSLLTLNAGFKLLHETVEKKLSVERHDVVAAIVPAGGGVISQTVHQGDSFHSAFYRFSLDLRHVCP